MGTVVLYLESRVFSDGNVSAPGSRNTVVSDVIEQGSSAYGDGAGKGSSLYCIDSQHAVSKLDDILVSQFLGVCSPRHMIAVRIHSDGIRAGG